MLVQVMHAHCGRDSTRRQFFTAGAMALLALQIRPSPVIAEANGEILRTAEAIHQERLIKAARKRVYEALTLSEQFDQIVRLSGVMQQAGLANARKPTTISREPGGAFTLFGGHIVGRQIELVPNELIVQAWREVSWDKGVYSIARFELIEQNAFTKLIFDHTAFPAGGAEHLARGWKDNYWDPLGKFLAL